MRSAIGLFMHEREFLEGLATRKSGVGRGFIRLGLQPRSITGPEEGWGAF